MIIVPTSENSKSGEIFDSALFLIKLTFADFVFSKAISLISENC